MTFDDMWSQYQEEYDQIKELHSELPKWVSRDHITQELLPTIGLAAVAVTILFGLNNVLIRWASGGKMNYKAAYQVTNMLVNTTLGSLGIYYHYLTHRVPMEEMNMIDLAVGNHDVNPVACIQFGFNLWAIPVGLLLVNESRIMLVHHISVIVTSFMTLFLPLGYRYFAPFMFGILETSSVPLAMMNTFRENKGLQKRFPSALPTLRLVFAVVFLYVRWYLYLPIKYDYLRLYGMGVLATIENEGGLGWIVYTATVWVASFFLLILQLYWGLKVVAAILGAMMPKEEENKKKE